VQGTAYGIAKNVGGKITMVDVKTYPATKVTPPDGVKSDEWIKSGFKAGK
jgi:branched-chain amino acid transport system substrate-binding protein